MSVTVAAALKKIAVALLSDPKVLKKVCAVVLVLLVALFAPLISLMALFTGNLEFSPENLDMEGIVVDAQLQDVLDVIETAFTDAGLEARLPEAQLLLLTHLHPYASEEKFADRLVACFTGDPTDQQLIEAVNTEFGTDISPEEFDEAVKELRQEADTEADQFAPVSPLAAPCPICSQTPGRTPPPRAKQAKSNTHGKPWVYDYQNAYR